jgi:hypothetical protein
MTEPHLNPGNKSWISLWRTNPITMTFAAVGLVVVAAAATTVVLNKAGLIKFNLLRFFVDSDEAPIRVRNGSLELRLLDLDQEWDDVKKDKTKWTVKGKKRKQGKFDVTVAAKAGADCPGALTALQPVVVFTYSDSATLTLNAIDEDDNDKEERTVVRPKDAQMNATGNVLTHGTSGTGHISKVEAGASPNQLTKICSFGNKDQLDSILILNVK